MDTIRESFKKYFEAFGIQLPDPMPAQGQLCQGGWTIRYIMLSDEQGQPYLEFIAHNRFTNSRHERILNSGERISLPSIEEGISYDPKVPGDREAAEARMRAHNNAVMNDLKKKGLI